MVDAAFAGAGQKPGLEIWRIEKLCPVKFPGPAPAGCVADKVGDFYTGDSYIVLKTKQKPKSSSLEWDLFFWLGEESSQDEMGACAYKVVELDESLGGGPVQFREVQNHESSQFMALFPKVNYKNGGVASGFKHVKIGVYDKRLLQLKGSRNVRVKEVDCKATSLNNGDVFILDDGLKLYQWSGSKANKKEKAKGLDVLLDIKDNERGGKASTEVFDEGSEPQAFWDALGGKGAIKDASEAGDDEAASKAAEAKLYNVSDSSGQMVMEQRGAGKLSQDLLTTDDCYILDLGNEMYVWIGKGTSPEEKKAGMTYATQFIEKEGRPKHTRVQRVTEGNENQTFKTKFCDWKIVPVAAAGGNVAKAGPQEGAGDLMRRMSGAHEKPKDESMVDDGSGKLEIWRIENFEKAPYPPELYGQFYAGDTFILQYTYMEENKECYILYFWQGRDSSQDEKGASAILVTKMDDDLGGAATQVRVTQNKEPDHFRTLFKGKMIIHEGGIASAFKNAGDVDSIDKDGISLFHVKGHTMLSTRGIQVPEKATSLNSGDCFVLMTESTLYAWKGSGASDVEYETAKGIAAMLAKKRTTEEVQEGSEPDAFWEALGGKADYPSAKELPPPDAEPRLFQGSNASGVFLVEEIFDFSQDDLEPDDVYILDVFNTVYLWVGQEANKEEKKMAMECAKSYVTQQHEVDGRDLDTPITRVPQGKEPPMFRACFLGWDPAKSKTFADPFAAKLEAMGGGGPTGGAEPEAAAADDDDDFGDYKDPNKEKFTIEQIRDKAVTGLDPTKREAYLSDADFEKYMKSPRSEFYAMKPWKQNALKKEAGLF